MQELQRRSIEILAPVKDQRRLDCELMNVAHSDGKNSCITEALEMRHSSRTHRRWDTKEGRQTVFTPRPFGDHKNSTLYRGREKCTKYMEASSGRRLLDPARAQEIRVAVLADKVPRHPLRFSASRLHRKSGMPSRRQNPISAKFHASCRSEGSTQRYLAVEAAAAKPSSSGRPLAEENQ